VLEVTNVSVDFGSVTALAGVTLTVAAGQIVGVTGEPGSGKTALVRCLSGDLAPSSGTITLDGEPLVGGLRAAERQGVAVVWQELQLCETLDVAGNLLLGRESRRHLLSGKRLGMDAASLLEDLGIPIDDTSRLVATLTIGEKGLLALAMALVRRPRLLVLDEPTAALGVLETSQVEQLLQRVRAAGTTIVLASRDVGQMFRVADRIVVLRRGSVVAQVDPANSHPDDVAALMVGTSVDRSARRQLMRLHGLADSLAVADPSSGLSLIIAALAAALNIDRSHIDLIRAESAATSSDRVIVDGNTWLVPVAGPAGTGAVIAIRRDSGEPPSRDELDLLGLYAGYAGAALERQEAEAAQREAGALRRSRELQRQFLSRLSHELRTPLTAIRGYASSLMAPDIVWDDDSQERFLERIAAESARLGRLVDDLLDFSAIDSGVMRMQFDWCELELVLEAAIAVLPEPDRGAVTVQSDEELPVLWGDHDRLEQVFVNLLTNALRHNPEGTRATVTVRTRSGNRIEITVSDDGPGLPSEIRAALFDSGTRGRTRTSGAGLGLSIARGIVQAHGGEIGLDDQQPGTSFRIVLPLDAHETAPEPTPVRVRADA